MGITNSLGAFQAPGKYNPNHRSPIMADFVQTSGSAAGTTTVNVIAKEASADAFYLCHLSVAQCAATAAAETLVYAATATVLGQFGTGTADTLTWNFGPVGLACGNTDTYSVYVKSSATITAYFVATGYRLK